MTTSSPSVELSEKELEDFLCQLEGRLPVRVLNWKVKIGLDNSFEPAVYVYPTIEDDENEDMYIRGERWNQICSAVRQELENKIDPKRFLYVRFCFSSNTDKT